MKRENRYFVIHKPYKVLSQFSDEAGNPGLGTLFHLPKDVYPVGRLDLDSEGLLILTNDKSLNHRLLNPKFKHQRTYWVEVEGVPTAESLEKLRNGLEIKVGGKVHKTLPAQCESVTINIAERQPPVNYKKHPERTWIQIQLSEGKNRQVRKMTAKIGHPTLRLIRVAIEDIQMGDLKPGEIIQISKKAIYRKLHMLE